MAFNRCPLCEAVSPLWGSAGSSTGAGTERGNDALEERREEEEAMGGTGCVDEGVEVEVVRETGGGVGEEGEGVWEFPHFAYPPPPPQLSGGKKGGVRAPAAVILRRGSGSRHASMRLKAS